MAGISSGTPATPHTNTITETSLFSFTVPANSVAIGTTYEALLPVNLITGTGPPTLTLGWRLASAAGTLLTAFAGQGVTVLTPVASLASPGRIIDTRTIITFRSTGAAGSVIVNGTATSAMGTVPNFGMSAVATTTVDTTAAIQFHFCLKYTTAVAGTTAQINNGLILLSRL